MWKTEFSTAATPIGCEAVSFSDRGVNGSVVAYGGIIAAELVLVRDRQEPALGNSDCRQHHCISDHVDTASSAFECRRCGALMEDTQHIVSGGNVADFKAAVGFRGIEVGRIQHYDDGAHGRVYVTEDAHDAGAGEKHAARCTWRIETNIEQLAVVGRKGVVKNGVGVRKIDGRS